MRSRRPRCGTPPATFVRGAAHGRQQNSRDAEITKSGHNGSGAGKRIRAGFDRAAAQAGRSFDNRRAQDRDWLAVTATVDRGTACITAEHGSESGSGSGSGVSGWRDATAASRATGPGYCTGRPGFDLLCVGGGHAWPGHGSRRQRSGTDQSVCAISATWPPLIATSSGGVRRKTAFGVPAAAQISVNCSKS